MKPKIVNGGDKKVLKPVRAKSSIPKIGVSRPVKQEKSEKESNMGFAKKAEIPYEGVIVLFCNFLLETKMKNCAEKVKVLLEMNLLLKASSYRIWAAMGLTGALCNATDGRENIRLKRV